MEISSPPAAHVKRAAEMRVDKRLLIANCDSAFNFASRMQSGGAGTAP